jgi:hypothetical protein
LKSLAAIFLGAIMFLAIIPGYDTFAEKPDNVGKPEFVSIEKLLEPKKIQLPDGRVLEKRVHIFPNDNAAKPDGKGGGPPDGKGGGDKGSTCYAALSKGAIWKTTGESYIVDDSFSGLADGVTLTGIESSGLSGITQTETGVTDFDIVITNGVITGFTKN